MSNDRYIESGDLDLGKIFKTLYEHKWSLILFIILTTAISLVYNYYKPKIYEASATLEINSNNNIGSLSQDIVKEALMGNINSRDIDTEISIIKSRFIILDTMKSINMTTHIWGVNQYYKKIELYKDAPFDVNITRGKNLKFKLTNIDNRLFNLEVKGSRDDGTKFHYNRKFEYNKPIITKDFSLIVSLSGEPFNFRRYEFIDYDANDYADLIRNSNLLNVSVIRKKANILEISYMDSIPRRAKDFVNTLAKTYMKQSIETKTKDATQTLNFINRQLSIIESNLKKSEKNIENFKARTKTVDVKLKVQQLSQELSDYETKTAVLDMKISLLRAILNKIKRGASLDRIAVVGLGGEDSTINSLISQLQQAKLQRAALLQEYTYQHPEVKKLSSQIANLRAVIKDSVKTILKSYIQKRAIYAKKMKQYQKELKKLPVIQQNYLSLQRNFAFNEKFYTYLLEKKTETEIKKAATVSKNRILDYALLPKDPIKPNKKLALMIGIFSGLFLWLIYVLAKKLINRTIKSVEDIETSIKAPIIGTIPKFKSENGARSLVVYEKPKSLFAESFRTLRTNLMFMLKGKGSKIISITSTVSGEGKTVIAANLGVVLQMMGKRVIILNFDLRKPTLHRVFDVPNTRGLSAYLAGQADLNEIAIHTFLDNLDIIPAGTIPPNPSELIISDRTKELLDKLKKYYDYIIIDTPPVGIVTDARILLSYSDLVLYVLKAGESKFDYLQNINVLYEQEDIQNMAVILNGVDKNEGYGNGYKYGYGGGYGYYEE